MRIRRAVPGDAELLAEHRAAVWHEVGDWSRTELAPQIPVWTTFMRDRIGDATLVAFIAEQDGSVLGSGSVLVHVTIPRPGLTSDRAGRVQSVYVLPAARRTGVARSIMRQLVDYARETILVSLTLHPSDEARHLYLSLGFEPADEMVLRFTPE